MTEVRIEGEDAVLVLSQQELGSGADGTVSPHPLLSHLCFKRVVSPAKKMPKVDALIDNPPVTNTKSVRIARPLRRVLSVPGDHPIGFTMERASGTPLADLLNPFSRPPSFQNMQRRLEIILKLADAVSQLNADGYVLFDGLDPQNVMIGPRLWLVDVDGWQVEEPNGAIHHAEVIHPEICPPELVDREIATVTLGVEIDAWILATLTFWIVTGHHPFAAKMNNPGTATLEDRIADGLWPYTTRARRRGILPHPAAPLSLFHPAMRKLVTACFDRGSLNPAARPTLDCWKEAITKTLNDRGFLAGVQRMEAQIAGQQATAFGSSAVDHSTTRPSPRQWQLSGLWPWLVVTPAAVAIVVLSFMATSHLLSTARPPQLVPSFDPPRLVPSSAPPYFGEPRPTPEAWRRMSTNPVSRPRQTPTGSLSEPPSDVWKRLQDLSKETPQ